MLVTCVHLLRLTNASEINQANCLIQLALQLSSMNSLHRILGWHQRSTLFKLLGLSASEFLHLNRKWHSSSNSSIQNGQFMSACSDSPLHYLCLWIQISLTPNRNRTKASLNFLIVMHDQNRNKIKYEGLITHYDNGIYTEVRNVTKSCVRIRLYVDVSSPLVLPAVTYLKWQCLPRFPLGRNSHHKTA